ncbi:MAG: hypothetical protein PHC69_03510, partial [Ruminiclostridium sp.]|nr:hypothetical protein [Ruminiclostridium sp.]
MNEYKFYDDQNNSNENCRDNVNNNIQNTNPYYSYYSEQKQNDYDDLKTSHFYSERYEKPRKGK